MYQFESPSQPDILTRDNATTNRFLSEVFEVKSALQPTQKAEKMIDRELAIDESKPEIIEKFGAIGKLTLPAKFVPETGPSEFGSLNQRIYHSKADHENVIVTALVQSAVGATENSIQLQKLLNLANGPLDDAHKQEANAIIAKFGDNQFGPGTSSKDYGADWTAPNYFVKEMQIRELNGIKILTVEGAYTPPPWTPKDGIENAPSRFEAIFMLAPDGKIQTLYLEANSKDFDKEQKLFDRSLRSIELLKQ
ncbi:MAG: hypothetical protein JST89_00230 [Cyanobacteria bacterium SZAS-4]|nr:hypothetical protein [Cyanobacteria bacterium SZAS-4]